MAQVDFSFLAVVYSGRKSRWQVSECEAPLCFCCFLSLRLFVLGLQGLCNSPGLWQSRCLATVVAVIRSKHIHEASQTVQSSESKNTRQVCSKKKEKKNTSEDI